MKSAIKLLMFMVLSCEHGLAENIPQRSYCFEERKIIHPKKFTYYGRYTQLRNTDQNVCELECFYRSECNFVTYFALQKLCYLHAGPKTVTFIDNENSVFIEMSTWNSRKDLKGCATRPCPIHTRCVTLKNNNYTCVISECGYGVSIPNLHGWYLRSVGVTKKLKCKPSHYLNGTTITSTCLANGNWTYDSEIKAECLPLDSSA